jgi:hypothetical protein
MSANLNNPAIRTSTDKLVNCQCSREYLGFDVEVSNFIESFDSNSAIKSSTPEPQSRLADISVNFLTTFEARKETE